MSVFCCRNMADVQPGFFIARGGLIYYPRAGVLRLFIMFAPADGNEGCLCKKAGESWAVSSSSLVRERSGN
ncbi:hypothetical protein [Candidatus Ichthyocystis hellenicum]|uniref:hypothetical protein n=1 Tax=Candidatus Ichthyocystis hellenicum TaxID=1561003 RepID=UPI000B882C1E|nr:hypothetical protein [Candidatus Ichthyocystis hellenicum]